MNLRILGLTSLVLLCAATAQAEGSLDKRDLAGLTVAGKIGGGVGAPFNEFGGSFVGELELGYLFPLPAPVGRSLGIFAAGAYSQPKTEGEVSEPDPRLPGDGVLRYDVTERQAALSFGLAYRLQLESLCPYLAGGVRVHMLETAVSGDAGGESFGTNKETDVEIGGYVTLGVDVFLGPGAFLGEVQMPFGGVDGYILRNTNVAALNLAIGYRLFF